MLTRVLGVNTTALNSFLPRDNYTVDERQIISIRVQNRKLKEIRALLSDDIQLNAHAQWEDFTATAGSMLPTIKKLITAINTVSGRTLQQPWFSRKQFKQADPLTFTIPLHFVATNSARIDVWENVLAVYSLLYPRELGGVEGLIDDDAVISYASNSERKAGTKEFAENLVSTVNSLSGLLQGYAIPGSTPFSSYTTDSEKPTENSKYCDHISVKLGVYGEFSHVYITDVQGSISHVTDVEGYPISADLSVTFSLQDSCWVQADGSFAFYQPPAEITNKLAGAISKLGGFVEDATGAFLTEAVKGLVDIKDGLGAISSLLGLS